MNSFNENSGGEDLIFDEDFSEFELEVETDGVIPALQEENLRKAEQVNIIKEREKENHTLFKKENVIAEKEISNTATIRKR